MIGCIVFLCVLFGMSLVIAVPCGVVSIYRPYVAEVTTLSIPLCPTADGVITDLYIGAPAYGVCDEGEQEDLLIPLKGLITGASYDQDVFLLHNLHGYKFDFSISDGTTTSSVISANVNMIPGEDEQGDSDDLEEFLLESTTRVGCPVRPTLVTVEAGIEPICEMPAGFPIGQGSNLRQVSLGEVKYSRWDQENIVLNFGKLKAIPRDFVDAPMMFFYSRRWTNASDLVIVCYIFGLVFPFFIAIIGVASFMCCNSSE